MPRILVVDDEYASRTGIKFILESEEFEIDEAPSKQAAINKLNESTFDAAIVDLRMPNEKGRMDLDLGIKLCNHIKDKHPQLPVIVVTVRNDEEARKALANINVVKAYVTKPFRMKKLIEEIRKITKKGAD